MRIFEPRYLDMIRECLRAETGFGICLIEDGKETDPQSKVCSVGTYVQIFDWDQLSDGLLGIHCRGVERFSIQWRSHRKNGLNEVEVDWRKEKPCRRQPSSLKACLRYLIQQVKKKNLVLGQTELEKLRDPHWLSYRLAELLPLTVGKRQMILETDDADTRLQTLLAAIHTLEKEH